MLASHTHARAMRPRASGAVGRARCARARATLRAATTTKSSHRRRASTSTTSSSTSLARALAAPSASAKSDARRGMRVAARASPDASYDAGDMTSAKDKLSAFLKKNSYKIDALLNIAIVGSVAGGAVFGIVEVDSDISTGWTWYEVLRNIPQDNLAAYQSAVFAHPLPVKAMTSGVAYTLGDFTCQLSQGKTIETVDLKRSARSGVAGFLIHGPLCHYWLMWTEANLSFDGAWYGTPVKIIADQTAWSLFLNSAYTTCIMSLQGFGPRRIKNEIQATWYNAISAGWKFWPFVHAFTFSSIIPQDFKLLFVDCVEVIWVTILSAAVNRDAEKALQVPLNAEAERPAAQLQEQLDAEFTTTVTDGAGGLTVECDYDVETLPRQGSGSYYEDLEKATGVCEVSVDLDDPVDAGTEAGAKTETSAKEKERTRVDEEAMSSR